MDGYDTVQELAYYRRYGAALEPDHVVLVYHFNDTSLTPVLFLDEQGNLIQYANRSPRKLDPRLVRWSYLYRAAAARTLREPDPVESTQRVMDSLAELRETVCAEGPRFSVLVQPYLLPPGLLDSIYVDEMYRRHNETLERMGALGLEPLDLAVPTRAAIEAGVAINEVPGDIHHPSLELARRWADWCLEQPWGAASFPHGLQLK